MLPCSYRDHARQPLAVANASGAACCRAAASCAGAVQRRPERDAEGDRGGRDDVKTMTALLVRTLLEADGRRTGLLGTVKSAIGAIELSEPALELKLAVYLRSQIKPDGTWHAARGGTTASASTHRPQGTLRNRCGWIR